MQTYSTRAEQRRLRNGIKHSNTKSDVSRCVGQSLARLKFCFCVSLIELFLHESNSIEVKKKIEKKKKKSLG